MDVAVTPDISVRRCHCYEAGDHGLLVCKLQGLGKAWVVDLREALGALLAGGARARRGRAARQVPRPALWSQLFLRELQRSNGHWLWRRLFGDLTQTLNPQGALTTSLNCCEHPLRAQESRHIAIYCRGE